MGKQELVALIRQIHAGFEDAKDYRRAVLGRGVHGETSAKVPDRPGYVYVRNREDPRQVYQVLQGSAPDRPGWPVVVGPAEVQDTIKRIVDSDWPTISTWPTYSGSVGIVGEHHEQHEYGAFDMVNVDKGMIRPFRIRPDYPTPSWYVIIEADDAAYLGPRHIIFSGISGYQETPVRGVRKRIFYGTGSMPGYDQAFTAVLTEDLRIEFITGTKRSSGGFPGGFPAPSGPFTTPSIGVVATQNELDRPTIQSLLARNLYPIGRVVIYATGTSVSWKNIEPLQPLYTWPGTWFATGIYIGDVGGYFTGTTVEAALQEIGTRVGGGSITGSVAYLNREQTFIKPQVIRASGIVTVDVIADGLVGLRAWSRNHIGLDGESANHIGVYGGSVNNTAGWFEIKYAAKNVWPYGQPTETNTTSPVVVVKRTSEGQVRNGNLTGPLLLIADEMRSSGTVSGHLISAGLNDPFVEQFYVGRTGSIGSAGSMFISGTVQAEQVRPTVDDLPAQRMREILQGDGATTQFYLATRLAAGTSRASEWGVVRSLNSDYFETAQGYSLVFATPPTGTVNVEYDRGYENWVRDGEFMEQTRWTLSSGSYVSGGHLSTGSVQGLFTGTFAVAFFSGTLSRGLYTAEFSAYRDGTGTYSLLLHSSDRTRTRWASNYGGPTGVWQRQLTQFAVPHDDAYAIGLWQADDVTRFDDVLVSRVGPLPLGYNTTGGVVKNGSFYDSHTPWFLTGSFGRSESWFREVVGGSIRSTGTALSVASQNVTLEVGTYFLGFAFRRESPTGGGVVRLLDGGVEVYATPPLGSLAAGKDHSPIYHVPISTRKTYTLELRSTNSVGFNFTAVRMYKL